jgi:hypothetical protein
MPIIRRQLIPSEVYPDDIRYNPDTETVQSLIGDEWVDNPLADPRTQTTLPPRLTSDPACDAAASVTAALKNQIDGVLVAIDGAQSAFTIAGIILSLFTFGVFGIFISLALFLAHAMLDAGTGAISAALTEAAYDTLTCILFCHMDNEGRITGQLNGAKTDVEDQIGGLGATILNAMLTLAGEGGVNNLASLGDTTGDCSDCDCTPCENITDFHLWSYGGQAFGLDLEYGSNFIEITPELYSGDGAYYITLSTEDNTLCCTPIAIEYLDNAPVGDFYHIWNGCGESNDFSARHTSIFYGESVQSFSEGWLTNPGRVRITFSA